ncbi:MAG: HdeD family acid-resistance protein [Chloroflexota bacterium]|nr:HdeD family acid-resistance protein [Chloroflexota bacterium]
MLKMMTGKWWVLLVRGIAAILFGLAAMVWPGLTIGALIIMFGAFAIVDGVGALFAAFAHRGEAQYWWATALEGVVGIVLGILVMVWPGISAIALLFWIAAWAIVTGVFEVVSAIQLRKEISGEFWLILSGVLSILFGIFAFIRPGAGALAVIWVIAIYAIVFGITLIMLSFKVRGLNQALA